MTRLYAECKGGRGAYACPWLTSTYQCTKLRWLRLPHDV